MTSRMGSVKIGVHVQQEEMSIINVYVHHARAPGYVKIC